MKLIIFGMDASLYGEKEIGGKKFFDPSQEIKLAEIIAKNGNDVVLCCERPIDESYPIPKNMKVCPIPLNVRMNENQMLSHLMRHKIDKMDFDAVFCTSISGAIWGNYLAKLKGIKCFCQVLDVPLWRLHKIFRHQYPQWTQVWNEWLNDLERCDFLISNHQVTINRLKMLGHNKDNIKIIYYGFDKELVDKTPEQDKEYDLVTVNRLIFYKGYDLLFCALRYLREQYKLSPRVLIIGSGNEQFSLVQQAIMLELNIDFVGPVSNEEKFIGIKKSKIGVSADYEEGIGCVFGMEAISCGLPFICWDLPIHHERFGETPHFIKKFNVVAFAEKIKSLLENYKVCNAYKPIVEYKKEEIDTNRSLDYQAKETIDFIKDKIGYQEKETDEDDKTDKEKIKEVKENSDKNGK